jgi:hypothetical protein
MEGQVIRLINRIKEFNNDSNEDTTQATLLINDCENALHRVLKHLRKENKDGNIQV